MQKITKNLSRKTAHVETVRCRFCSQLNRLPLYKQIGAKCGKCGRKLFEAEIENHKSNFHDENKWPSGLLICIFVCSAAFAFGSVKEGHSVFITIGAVVLFSPIAGFLIYTMGQMIFAVLSYIFDVAYNSASARGLPAPVAFVWAIFCMILFAYAMDGGLK